MLLPECGKPCLTPQGLGKHREAQHGVKVLVRDRLCTFTCRRCLKYFHCRTRIIKHLERGSDTCRQWYLDYAEVIDPRAIAEAEEEERVRMRHSRHIGQLADKAERRQLRAQGPLQKSAAEAPRVRRDRPARYPTERHKATWQLVQGGQIPPCVDFKVLVALHLFSGRRRPGDLQWSVESQQPTQRGTVFVLSIDCAIDPVKGNLLDRKAVAFWVDKCKQGAVHAVVAGPPHVRHGHRQYG